MAEQADRYALGRLVLDYIRTFMWPAVALIVVVIYQDDVRTILSERQVDIFGLRIGEKVEQIESQALAEIADVRALLEAQQARGAGAASPEITEDIEAKLASLERNLSREIAEVQQARDVEQRAQRSLPAPQTRAPTESSRAERAAAAELRGFQALAERNLAAAREAFDRAYEIWPEYHNVDEIRRLLNQRRDELADPDSAAWPQLYRAIMTRYSWGLPEELRPVFREGATRAY